MIDNIIETIKKHTIDTEIHTIWGRTVLVPDNDNRTQQQSENLYKQW